MKPTESINMALIVHRVNDLEQNFLTDQHWEVIDTILTHSNFQEIPMHFFGNPEELMVRLKVLTSGLPLCVVPQVFHFPKLVVWCTEHFSPESKTVVSKTFQDCPFHFQIKCLKNARFEWVKGFRSKYCYFIRRRAC